ncbi:hypothetical protein FHW04_002092 [Pantoea sp. AN62]
MFLFSHPGNQPVVLLYAAGLYHANMTLRSGRNKCDSDHVMRVVAGVFLVTMITKLTQKSLKVAEF